MSNVKHVDTKDHELEGCFAVFPEKRPTNYKSNPQREKIEHGPALTESVRGLKNEEKKSESSAHVVINLPRSADKAAYTTPTECEL
jgi:hypothetical protein